MMRRIFRNQIHAQARSLLRSEGAKTWSEALAQADDLTRCGARAKSTGRQCRARPLPGKTKCKVHGGATPKRTPEQREAARCFAASQPRVRGRFVKKLEAAE
jgi:hypothetical protein